MQIGSHTFARDVGGGGSNDVRPRHQDASCWVLGERLTIPARRGLVFTTHAPRGQGPPVGAPLHSRDVRVLLSLLKTAGLPLVRSTVCGTAQRVC
jgi:hypothetical protein